ncbi:MAG TPA: universal stress protein, partial [Pyrinomonadaceae bacterium]|nr:universal stress protein [Pyrinomonadaceae bacterium]
MNERLKILIAYDGSECADAALDDLRKAGLPVRGVEALMVSVAEAERLAALAAERLRKNFPNWKVAAEATCGSPAWEVIMKADGWKPDLIVVGSHGRN